MCSARSAGLAVRHRAQDVMAYVKGGRPRKERLTTRQQGWRLAADLRPILPRCQVGLAA